ncbi:MAG: hypothetical protein ACJ77B_08370, partial [Chloroflexota bacterium]
MNGPRRSSLAVVAAFIALLVAPAAASAHPLGNFTINVYAGVRVSQTRITVDAVLDRAEIPTFQERLRIDTDGDGDVSPDEADAARAPECEGLERGLVLTLDGARVALELTAAGVSFPAGAAGLSTMRVVCELTAPMPSATANVKLDDVVEPNRLGWREIVVEADGVTATPTSGTLRTTSVSDRLRSYPKALLATPLRETSVEFTTQPGGPTLPAAVVRDAQPIAGVPQPAASAPPPATSGRATAAAAVPGGVGSDIPDIFRVTDLTPAVVL